MCFRILKCTHTRTHIYIWAIKENEAMIWKRVREYTWEGFRENKEGGNGELQSQNILKSRAGDAAQLAECLVSVHKALGPIPSAMWTGCGMHTCNRSTQEVEAVGERVQGHPQLYNEFKAGLGYMKSVSQHFFTGQLLTHCALLFAFIWIHPGPPETS